MMDLFHAILYGLFGVVTGSFLNVCIVRIPEGESVAAGRSHCPLCGRQILARDLVPVLSWIFLGGRCRFCKERIPIQYPVVEAVTGLLFFLCCTAKGPGADAVIMCIFGSLLITAAWIDARYMYIPDRINLLILLLASVSLTCSPVPGIKSRITGAVLCGGFLILVSIFTKGGVGGGDIKLLASSGLLLGVKAAAASLLSAYIMAGLWYAVPLIRGQVNSKTKAPMAPFFALSLMVFGLWCDGILSWYMGLFLPAIP